MCQLRSSNGPDCGGCATIRIKNRKKELRKNGLAKGRALTVSVRRAQGLQVSRGQCLKDLRIDILPRTGQKAAPLRLVLRCEVWRLHGHRASRSREVVSPGPQRATLLRMLHLLRNVSRLLCSGRAFASRASEQLSAVSCDVRLWQVYTSLPS